MTTNTWRARLYDALGDLAALSALAAEMATLLDVDGAPGPRSPSGTGNNAERQRRYRQRHSNGTVTPIVTPTVTDSNVTRNVTRNAVVQELQQQLPREVTTSSTSSLGSESSFNSAPRVFGNLEQAVETVTRNVTRNAERYADSNVTRNGERNADHVTEAMAVSTALGAAVSDKLRAMFRRHNVAAPQQRAWVRLTADILKDPSYRPDDIGAACDDDDINPITKGPMGFRSFVTAARDKRLRDGTAPNDTLADLKRLLPYIEARRGSPSTHGEPWWNWCIAGAAREGMVNAYVFAAKHFDDPWPET